MSLFSCLFRGSQWCTSQWKPERGSHTMSIFLEGILLKKKKNRRFVRHTSTGPCQQLDYKRWTECRCFQLTNTFTPAAQTFHRVTYKTFTCMSSGKGRSVPQEMWISLLDKVPTYRPVSNGMNLLTAPCVFLQTSRFVADEKSHRVWWNVTLSNLEHFITQR